MEGGSSRDAHIAASAWQWRFTVLLAAVGGFDIAGGLWHHPDTSVVLLGCLNLALAVARSVFA